MWCARCGKETGNVTGWFCVNEYAEYVQVSVHAAFCIDQEFSIDLCSLSTHHLVSTLHYVVLPEKNHDLLETQVPK